MFLIRNRALIAEHGLSFWVETEQVRILFDCSASSAARKNAAKMDIAPETADYVVLSHSHYDHAVGSYGRFYDFETPPARFVRKTGQGMVQDDFPDEISLVLESGKGRGIPI